MSADEAVSTYLDLLPAPLREGGFLGRFLLAFEAVLDTGEHSLSNQISSLAMHFEPMNADEEFLPWLASWVGLTLRADLTLVARRRFLQEIVSLYRLRGTRDGLQKILQIYLDPGNYGITSDDVVIKDTYPQAPHFFTVQLTLNAETPDPEVLHRIETIARAIIDQEKPAHTFYGLKLRIRTMRLVSPELREREGGVPPFLILGKTTRLGSADFPPPRAPTT